MKQGSASSSGAGSRKIEPISKAINPGTVADIGLQQVRMRPHKDLGRGYKAPMASASNHPCGSQGKH
jgi:hypothetical protein